MAKKRSSSSQYFKVKESLEAAQFIVKKPKHVQINDKNIVNLGTMIMEFFNMNDKTHKEILTNIFLRPELYPDFTEKTVDWLFVFHTLNFSLFYPKDTKQWIAGNTTGCNALSFAIKRAIDEGEPLWDPKYYATLTRSKLKLIFRSDDDKTIIPLLNERLKILHKVGNVLLKKFKGSFNNCIKFAQYNPKRLVNLLFDNFESYRDEAKYNYKNVRLYTKANSLVSDIWAFYREKNKFHLNKENMMSTMFIDYRSSIVLHHFGVFEYIDKLTEKCINNQPLQHGNEKELEIRACSLIAVHRMSEMIGKCFSDSGINLDCHNALILIDNYLSISIAKHFDEHMYDQYPFHYIISSHY